MKTGRTKEIDAESMEEAAQRLLEVLDARSKRIQTAGEPCLEPGNGGPDATLEQCIRAVLDVAPTTARNPAISKPDCDC